MSLTLYQFAISHYCEKIRWALDFKGLEYRTRTLLPGTHVATMKKLSGDSAVPVLVHDGTVVANSGAIISYLDAHFPDRPLTPADAAERAEAVEWERLVDDEVGVHVRLCCYHILLEHPSAVVPLLTHEGPWYGPMLYKFIFPKLKARMRALMKINERTFQVSRKRLERAIDKLARRIDAEGYLVGGQFTRADLAAASMLAPLVRPAQYGMDWPDRLPEELELLSAPWAEQLAWVGEMYSRYR